jgi:predicted DNA-binding protein
MITLTLNLSKEAEQELEKALKHLEETTKKPLEYHIKEALIRYLEDMEDVCDALERSQKESKTYTTEELLKECCLERVNQERFSQDRSHHSQKNY